MAVIHDGSDSELVRLARVLRSGGVVAVPTETVYGLAANAFDAEACRQVFAIKGRPANDPLIVHVADAAMVREVGELNEPSQRLAAQFWPGPLTLIVARNRRIPDVVTSGRDTVAVRMPAHPLFRRLIEITARPLAAPSANSFGMVSPTSAEHVERSLGDKIEHILDGGPCPVGVESTIVDARDPADPVILRPGGIGREALEAALGQAVRVHQGSSSKVTGGPAGEIAPGMLDKHYGLQTTLVLREGPFSQAELAADAEGIARVCFRRPDHPTGTSVYWLSETGDAAEAARNLFALMRELDALELTRIEFEPAPKSGLGLAINDRLRRAAAR